MIKSLFVPIDGNAADDGVFATALAVARPLAAHLYFYHVRFTPWQAAVRSRHVEFCVGSEISVAHDNLRQQDEDSSAGASKHFLDFCDRNAVDIRWVPGGTSGISAELVQETDHAEARLLFRARHSDMVVMGRPRNEGLISSGLIEILLLGSGRPILIAPETPPGNVTDTIMVGWKDSSEAVRSLASALPLLKLARRVVLVHILESHEASPDELNSVVLNLAWHGISAETLRLVDDSRPAAQLQRVAAAERATLLVVGGYGHRPLSEAVFGGITRTLIEYADLPVFLMH
jgi:nucleotide-binding universal stress UspA family protein